MQYLVNGSKEYFREQMVPGSMRTKWEMSCPLPEALPEQGGVQFRFEVQYIVPGLFGKNTLQHLLWCFQDKQEGIDPADEKNLP